MKPYELMLEMSGNRPYLIVAMPEGHRWTSRELTHPSWRRIRVSLLDIEVEALAERQFRGINILALPSLAPFVVTDVSRERFLAAVTERI